jgi:hypothetical protein
MSNLAKGKIIGSFLLFAAIIVGIRLMAPAGTDPGRNDKTGDVSSMTPSVNATTADDVTSGSDQTDARSDEPQDDPARAAYADASPKLAALQTMEEASVSYDPAQLPVIRPYLVHPDPEIRQSAVNAMVVLGDAAASPMLREAAKLAPSAKEAVAMEEAADYLELPPANLSEILGRRRAKTEAQPDSSPPPSEQQGH